MDPIPAPVKAALNVPFLLKMLVGVIVLAAGFEVVGMFFAPAATFLYKPIATVRNLFSKPASP